MFILFFTVSVLIAQSLSGYTGSNRREDGYIGPINKVTISKTRINDGGEDPGAEATTEITYDKKGRRTSMRTGNLLVKYAYTKDSFTATTDGNVTTKATFNEDGTLNEYISYNSAGKIIIKDTYTYSSDGNIVCMNRTDEKDNIISSWFYTVDMNGNTVVKNEDNSISYTFSPKGVLLEEFVANNENSWSEKIYDSYGFESAVKIYSFPDSGMIMQKDIPTTEITYTTESILDDKGRIKELISGRFTKQNEKWFNERGDFVSSEERRNSNITLSWLSYRYDGKLAEIHTERWTSPSEENPTGYSSNTDEYLYNNDAALTQIVSYNETGNETERIIFTYDDYGNLFVSEAANEPNEKNYYSWNDENQLMSKLCCIEDESLFYTGIEEYSYNEDGSAAKTQYTQIWRIIIDEQPKKTSQFSSKAESIFFYNQEGLLSRKETLYDDRKEIEFYDYDEEGREVLLSLITKHIDGTELYAEKSYRYMDDIDYTEMTEYDSFREKKIYSYDELGNISTIQEYEIQYIDGEYKDIPYSVTTYTYN